MKIILSKVVCECITWPPPWTAGVVGCGKGLARADLASFLGLPPHHVRGKDSDKRKVGKEARADVLWTSQFLGHPEERNQWKSGAAWSPAGRGGGNSRIWSRLCLWCMSEPRWFAGTCKITGMMLEHPESPCTQRESCSSPHPPHRVAGRIQYHNGSIPWRP